MTMPVATHRTTHVFLGTPAIIASEPMQRILALAARVARSDATVLITGESGSGKEMIARAVHYYSNRSPKPWVDLNCAALPENLLESELFGYEKGAFSGADATKPGLFELAHQGTIFLDEIGELDPRVQVKLLRVLDGAPYYRLGGVKKVTVDVRVVAATNADLESAVEQGRFRSDLYHRLSQFTLQVPPLRERGEDVAPLAEYFLAQSYPGMKFSSAAVAAMQNYSWPGNIRELRNAVMRAGIVTDSEEIQPCDLPLKQFSGTALPSLPGGFTSQGLTDPGNSRARDSRTDDAWAAGNSAHSLETAERRLIFEALHATGGHHQRAADRLGISRRTLTRKLKVYGGWRDNGGRDHANQTEVVA
jgi:DNA-binding NtrC family response regulator